MGRGAWRWAALALPAAPVAAATLPQVDTEDASLGGATVGEGRLHVVLGLDVRNGDFARGGYDDDAASLDRLPVHAQIGLGAVLHEGADGKADAWAIVTSSNGVHAPGADERTRPRAWYESNNVAALIVAPAEGLRTGLAYTIKTSPNGVSSTTHEASATLAYDGDGGLGALHPGAAITVRPKGGHGVFTQANVEPELALGAGEDAPTLSFPALVGVGWGGFYAAGSGTVAYGSAGLALTRPFAVGTSRWQLRAEALALIRDDRLRRLGTRDAETATIVPLVTVSLRMAY